MFFFTAPITAVHEACRLCEKLFFVWYFVVANAFRSLGKLAIRVQDRCYLNRDSSKEAEIELTCWIIGVLMV